CSLPTGLGKTSVIHIWLLALAANPETVPRRLVYVVNRRTVVDQSTDEAEKMRDRLKDPALAGVVANLRKLCAGRTPEDVPLAISTLRGQFADNREWSADPSCPAVICGTVDMIGSRLLFSGYGCGFKSRPLHAGFLGQDVLLVHDEAHLEPAFQRLLTAVRDEQRGLTQRVHHPDLEFQRLLTAVRDEQERYKEFRQFHVMELTATSRGGSDQFGLEKEDRDDPTVQKRIGAKKAIHLYPMGKKLTDDIVKYAQGEHTKDRAVLIFVRQVKDVGEIVKKLPEGAVEPLTGTLRGKERDELVKKPVFQRFLPASNRDTDVTPQPGTVYLVCTSAGEVGVNISADHLVCDLSTFDSMAQRFGRVNRFGARDDTRIDVVYPQKLEDDDLGSRLKQTLDLLRLANGDGSPATLGQLHEKAMQEGSGAGPMATDRTQALRDYILATYAPQPKTLDTSDILFDAWALTSVCKQLTGRSELPGRPPVDEYLHGVEDEKQRETHVAWREEVALFHRRGVTERQVGALLDEFPIRPHELLRDATWRVQDELAGLSDGREGDPVWVIDPDDTVRLVTLGRLVKKENKKYVENLSWRTVVLPPSVGGLTKTGTLSGQEPHDPDREYDVAGRARLTSGYPLVRLLVTHSEDVLKYKLVGPVLDLPPDYQFMVDYDEQREGEKEYLRDDFMARSFPPMRVAYRLDLSDEENDEQDGVEYLILKPESRQKVMKHQAAWAGPGRTGRREAVRRSDLFATGAPPEVHAAVTLAAKWHDLGKDRAVWQRGAGNTRGAKPVAKTLHGRPPENLNGFRHELASMVDVCSDPAFTAEFREQVPACQELLLHLIATHHGRARPHFPSDEAIDPGRPEAGAVSVVADTPQRFARLQRRYGRWGLAYLESLLRAADALDSRRIEETPIGESEPGAWPRPMPASVWPERKVPTPSITVAVDPTNPGQFFACCGLLELADRIWRGAEGWFGSREFYIACEGSLSQLLQRLSEATVSSSLMDAELKRLGTLQSMAKRKRTPEIAAELDDLRTRWRLERLHLSKPFDLWLDWWRDNTGERTDLKTWAAKVQVLGMARAFHGLIKSLRWDALKLTGCLTLSVRADLLPFYFDSDAGAQGSALDAGFSAYDLRNLIKGHSPKRPIIELGSFIAFQRFRPCPVVGTDRYRFSTWATPLPITAAGPVAVAAVEVPGTQWYEFRLFSRTQYMKTFLPATPLGDPR
ncbi:MAG: type I-U CRISPR-associated helicase/endonuclease Cas3, partial [Gemmataceae bacterium]